MAKSNSNSKEFSRRISKDINASNERGQTILHLMAAFGSAAGIKLIGGGFSADPNRIDRLGNTPLHYAARRGHADAVQELLALGADPKIRNAVGMTPKSSAENAGNSSVSKLLIRHSATRPVPPV
jgi:ankyrin repeat protein